MTTDQMILFGVLAGVFGMLIWGRYRYDLVAASALLVAIVLGVVPKAEAFAGFGHPAVIIIALVLVVSRGLMNSGAIDLVMKVLISSTRSLGRHIVIMSGIAAGLSAVMNNVGALALLMPVEIQAAHKAKRSPALTLMPLSFATILGGLITLIGTPPNIIISAFREQALGEPFGMFDFSPVGLVCAAVGVTYIALFGWRLIPGERTEHDTGAELFDLGGYVAEVKVPEDSKAVGQMVRDLDAAGDEHDAVIVGLVRQGKRLPGRARRVEIRKNDILVVEAAPDNIDRFVGALKLEYIGQDKHVRADGGGMTLMEVVVPKDARIDGRSADSVQLLTRHGVTLLGVSRQGKPFRERVRRLEIEAGDVLLLLGPDDRVGEITAWLGCLPLAERGLTVARRDKAMMSIGIFGAAIIAASMGLLYLPVALAIVVVAYVLLDITPLRSIYDSVEWPVIVLLGSMLPLGVALESTGGTALIADGIVSITSGFGPVVVLTLLMIVVMTLSDVLNNTATAVIGAPIALDIATRLDVNPDAFLMAVAIAASCAFLTPIGHKNNTLIMGPGGYKFGDYWRMGLPLEILVVAVAIPMILVVWPL